MALYIHLAKLLNYSISILITDDDTNMCAKFKHQKEGTKAKWNACGNWVFNFNFYKCELLIMGWVGDGVLGCRDTPERPDTANLVFISLLDDLAPGGIFLFLIPDTSSSHLRLEFLSPFYDSAPGGLHIPFISDASCFFLSGGTLLSRRDTIV